MRCPGAIYRMMDRGGRREHIYDDDVDPQDFLKTLAEACQKTGCHMQVYCRMPVHYDPSKLAMAARVMQETTLPIKWITAWVHMGTTKSLKTTRRPWFQAHENPANDTTTHLQLDFQPLIRLG